MHPLEPARHEPARHEPAAFRATPAAFLPLPVPARPAGERLLLLAVRVWGSGRRQGVCPHHGPAALLGPAARPLNTLLDTLCAAVGEPLMLLAPRALAITPDEAMLLDLVECAGRGDTAGARTLLADRVPRAVQDRLIDHAGRLALLLPSG